MAAAEVDLYHKAEALLEIHHRALIVPKAVQKKGGNRQAYRLWRMDPTNGQGALRVEFCHQVFEVLDGARITEPYFRPELAFGHSRFIWGSWFNNKQEVDTEIKNAYGISLPEGKFGVYHGADGPFTEARYIIQNLDWKKTIGAYMAVDPDTWIRYATEVGIPLQAVKKQLEAEQKVKVKSELPISTPA